MSKTQSLLLILGIVSFCAFPKAAALSLQPRHRLGVTTPRVDSLYALFPRQPLHLERVATNGGFVRRRRRASETSFQAHPSGAPEGDDDSSAPTALFSPQQNTLVPLIYGVLPALPAVILPLLNESFQSAKELSYLQKGADGTNDAALISLGILLVSKRAALYFIATVATVYAGWRADQTSAIVATGEADGEAIAGTGRVGPGEALDRLNREILKGERPEDAPAPGSDESADSEKIFARLDNDAGSSNVGNSVALILPLVLTASLFVSYSLLGFDTAFLESFAPSADAANDMIEPILQNLREILQPILVYLPSLPNIGVCLLFTSTELRSAFPSDKAQFGNAVAVLVVMGAFAGNNILPDAVVWSLRNSINISIAVTVARALAPFLIYPPPPGDLEDEGTDEISNTEKFETDSTGGSNKSIRTVALALVGLALFDAVAVFGTAASAAVDGSFDLASSQVTQATSVMESVARSKLDSQLWQPGLIEIAVGGKVTDALGLGDIIFPSCLVAWGWNLHPSYAVSAAGGYFLGSLATEVASVAMGGRGLPALVFLVPTMLVAVTLTALRRGELSVVWGDGSDGIEE